MIYWVALLFGIFQGITELLPISSSGHLLLLHQFFSLENIPSLSFDVVIHGGTLVALLFFFSEDIVNLLKGWFDSLRFGGKLVSDDARLSWMIIFATIPAGLVGYLAGDWFESVARNVLVVAVMLILGGIALIAVESVTAEKKELWELTWWGSFCVGCCQILALVPGVSRSGITIITGMILNLKRNAAVRFSFLLSIPIVAGAFLKEFGHLFSAGIDAQMAGVLLIGFLGAALAGFLTLRFFFKFIGKYSLRAFGWYRIVLGVGILVIYWVT